MAKKSKQLLQRKITGYTTHGLFRGRADLLIDAIIEGVGYRKIKEDSSGSRYVTIKNKQYHIKKSSVIYELDLFYKYASSLKKTK